MSLPSGEVSRKLFRPSTMRLKDPNQPPPFSMPSKLLMLHDGAKSESFTIGCVPESMFNYL